MSSEEKLMMLLKVSSFSNPPSQFYVVEIVTSEDSEGKPESVLKLRTMFNSCMDTETMETDGIPQGALDMIGENGSHGGWPAVNGNWSDDK